MARRNTKRPNVSDKMKSRSNGQIIRDTLRFVNARRVPAHQGPLADLPDGCTTNAFNCPLSVALRDSYPGVLSGGIAIDGIRVVFQHLNPADGHGKNIPLILQKGTKTLTADLSPPEYGYAEMEYLSAAASEFVRRHDQGIITKYRDCPVKN